MGPRGRRGATGSRGPRGRPGTPGEGGAMKCIPISFYGLGGPSVPDTGVSGCTGPTGGTGCFDPFISGPTGIATIGSSFPLINTGCVTNYCINGVLNQNDPIVDLYYLARGNLTPPDPTHDAELYQSTGNPGGKGVNVPPAWQAIHPATDYYYFERLGCCNEDQNRGYIWFVSIPEGSSKSVRERVEDKYNLNPGTHIFDSVFGNWFILKEKNNNLIWELECTTRGEIFKCICIRFNGLGGISNPRQAFNTDDTGDTPVGLQFQENIYFLDYGGPDADLYISTGLPEPDFWRGPSNPTEPYYYFEDLTPCSAFGIETPPFEPDFERCGLGTQKIAGNVGRIWFVDPVLSTTSRFNGKAVKLEVLCDLKPGDKVLDAATGRVFELVCKDACECVWVATCKIDRGTKFITGCIEYEGIFSPVGISEFNPADYEVGQYILVPTPAPYLFEIVDDGGSKKWAAVNDAPSEYYYAAFPPELPGTDGYVTLYYVRNAENNLGGGSFNTACNVGQTEAASGSELGPRELTIECNLMSGDKFYDCKTGDIYTFGQILLGDEFDLGIFFWSNSCVCNETRRGGNGQELVCVDIEFEGWTQPVTNPALVGPNGTKLLTLNDGTIYTATNGQWLADETQQENIYYLCVSKEVNNMMVNGPPFEIYFDPNIKGFKPTKIEEHLSLSVGDKVLNCGSNVLYELTQEGKEAQVGMYVVILLRVLNG
jgi:hypothetical protein